MSVTNKMDLPEAIVKAPFVIKKGPLAGLGANQEIIAQNKKIQKTASKAFKAIAEFFCALGMPFLYIASQLSHLIDAISNKFKKEVKAEALEVKAETLDDLPEEDIKDAQEIEFPIPTITVIEEEEEAAPVVTTPEVVVVQEERPVLATESEVESEHMLALPFATIALLALGVSTYFNNSAPTEFVSQYANQSLTRNLISLAR